MTSPMPDDVPHTCLTDGCGKPFGHDLDPLDFIHGPAPVWFADRQRLEAAAARVPELLHKIELLRADCGTYERQRDAARTESVALRARLAAAPDLTELVDDVLRSIIECPICDAELPDDCAVLEHSPECSLGRLLAAVPSTGEQTASTGTYDPVTGDEGRVAVPSTGGDTVTMTVSRDCAEWVAGERCEVVDDELTAAARNALAAAPSTGGGVSVAGAMRANGWSENEIGAAMDGRYRGAAMDERAGTDGGGE